MESAMLLRPLLPNLQTVELLVDVAGIDEVDLLEVKLVGEYGLGSKQTSLTSGLAFRDRATGRRSNREQPTEENNDDGTRGKGRGRGRGGPRRGGDRQSRTGVV